MLAGRYREDRFHPEEGSVCMKKHLNLLLAALLGLSILGVPACGGSASTDGAAEEPPAAKEATEPEEVVDPAEDFYGEWQLAAVKSEGLTMVGDLTELLEASETMKVNIEKGGEARMSFDGDTVVCTWEQKSDTTIVLKTPDETDGADASTDDTDVEDAVEGAEDAVEGMTEGGTEVEFTLEDGVLTVTSFTDEFDGTLYFSADGKLADYPAVDPADIAAVESVDAAVGDWALVGMYFMGSTAYGDADAMSSMIGEGNETIAISEDGAVEMMGETVNFGVGDEGGYIDVNGQAQLPVGTLDDHLTVDFTQAIGQDAILIYEK